MANDLGPFHVPVMATRCVDLIEPAITGVDNPVIIDATVGLGGHTELLLERFSQAQVIGVDRDPQALEEAKHRLKRFSERFIPTHATYGELERIARTHASGPVRAVLMDLGVSSMQIDQPQRGFSYSQDAPLDMRMNPTTGDTAADLLREASETQLRTILRDYGEEKFAHRIASRIVAQRVSEPITSSGQLVELIRQAIPAPARRTGGNPAKRTFQALRIAVNEELDILTLALPQALNLLDIGGRLVVMAYHSLEDRIVKRIFARGAESATPPGLPVELPGQQPYLRLLTRGAEQANAQEIEENPRARSVRLRAVEKTADVRKED